MNNEMAYLLGMICGNGSIQRGSRETIVSIEIPHKKLETEFFNDVKIYVKASIADIRVLIEPLIVTPIDFIQNPNSTILSFRKTNDDYLIRELLRYIGNASSHENLKINPEVFLFSKDERLQLLKGFADVTGYIRRSNYFFNKYMHRVYLEVPHNWYLVVDICNLLQSVDIPVQTIDWAHPNIRDSQLTKYNQGFHNFWKKEHQIKIWANEFLPINFGILHKREALNSFAYELINELSKSDRVIKSITHKYYWESSQKVNRIKPTHPCENDEFIPRAIRGKHYNSWREIANDLGYKEV